VRAQDLEGPDSLNWPKTIEAPEFKITVYQPQLETFQGNLMTARAAVSLQKAGSDQPVFGGVWFTARLLTDRQSRSATPVDVQVTEARFPASDPADVARLQQIVAAEFPKWRLTLSLDHILAELKIVQERKAAAQGLKNEAPRIMYRQNPAVLLSYDGEATWRPLPGSGYQRVANSAFFVVQDTGTGACFLNIPPYWYAAPGPMGPWQPTDTVPGAVQDLWNNEPKPGLPAADQSQSVPPRPEVIPVTDPTELIWTQGPAQYAPVSGTNLLYVTNTESDVFLDTSTQLYYVLLSGRWYRKAAGKGTWMYVPSDGLPADFGHIPDSNPKAHVLVSVAGTPEANDALLDTEIPQTVAINPGPAPELNVAYDGEPQFNGIDGCSVQYAVNTPYSVFSAGQRYYCCQDGIWYESGFPIGPWIACIRVNPDIYLIPPSCPHYYCTYCHVFSVTPGAIYVGYYPGYRGCYAWGRTVVYGTGWRYPSWHGAVWYPHPVTWGVGVRYNVSTCNWRFQLGLGGPCAWMGLNYRSDWKGHTTSVGVGGWWSGVGFERRQVDVHRNLEFERQASRSVTHNIYARQPERLAPIHSRLPEPVRPLPAERRAPNNVLIDHEGNAYRKPTEGGWEKHTPQGWQKDVPHATPQPPYEAPHVPPREPARPSAVPEHREPVRPPAAPEHREPARPSAVPEHREAVRPPPAPPVHHDVPPISSTHVQLEQHNQARLTGNERAQTFHQSPPAPHFSPPPSPSRQKK
jgi:hypothetical protein